MITKLTQDKSNADELFLIQLKYCAPVVLLPSEEQDPNDTEQ